MHESPGVLFGRSWDDAPANPLPDEPLVAALTRKDAPGITRSRSNTARPPFHLLIFLASLAAFSTNGLAKDIFVAQSAAGSNTGTDCADAHAYTFFNSTANWGSGPSQIGPGTTVHLCGVITSQLNAQGSGTAGNVITILFETNAKISLPTCGSNHGCLYLSGSSYITVDGGANGIIESTNSSPTLGYANNNYSYGIWTDGNYNTIQNLTIQNLFVHDPHDTTSDGWYSYGVASSGGYTTNLTIRNNTFNGMCFAMGASSNNMVISGNTIENINWGVTLGQPSSSTYSNIYIYGNRFSLFSTWDGNATFHHNGIHAYTGATPSGPMTNVYIYNNRVDNTGEAQTSYLLFTEGNYNFTMSNVWVFNNVTVGSHPANGAIDWGAYGDTLHVLNNTIVGAYPTGPEIQGSCISIAEAQNITAENNVISTCGGTQMGFSTGFTLSAVDYNLYAAENAAASYPWAYNGVGSNTISAWQPANGGSCPSTGLDCHGSYRSSAGLNSSGAPQAGSPVIGAGLSFYGLCSGQSTPGLGALCYDIAGNARPASGAWDAGAYQFGPQLQPPSNLSVTVH
jgi:hypothetical protein